MRKFRQMLKENGAFTLVELIVVIAVLGILAGIAVPRLTGVSDKAAKEALKSNANSLKRTIDMYVAENDELPISDSSLSFSDSEYNIDFSTNDYHIGAFSAYSTEGTLGTSDYSITVSESNDGGDTAVSDGYSVEVTSEGIFPSWESTE